MRLEYRDLVFQGLCLFLERRDLRLELRALFPGFDDAVFGLDTTKLENQITGDSDNERYERRKRYGSPLAVLLQRRSSSHKRSPSEKDVMLRGAPRKQKWTASRYDNRTYRNSGRDAALAMSLSNTARQRFGHQRGRGGSPVGNNDGPSSCSARAYTRRLK